MERYTEISLAELFELLLKDNYNNVYFKNNGDLHKATDYNWSLSELKKYKWFKHEVIE